MENWRPIVVTFYTDQTIGSVTWMKTSKREESGTAAAGCGRPLRPLQPDELRDDELRNDEHRDSVTWMKTSKRREERVLAAGRLRPTECSIVLII